jgi:thiosulfate dehydrogenase
MKAISAYIRWLGKDVPKGSRAEGSGFPELAYLDRAADPIRGKAVYEQKCAVCHGKEGQGQLRPDGVAFLYPPLWGKHSYNRGAGLYRLSNFARYVKANMPLGATFDAPQLRDEEAWDVAAYVNSLDHPGLDLSKDWPRMEEKPFDHPFGPYADGFPESQHKLGPYPPILAEKKKQPNTTRPGKG